MAESLPRPLGRLTILLEGDLGAGKSTFARALIQSLGHTGAVPSPTYTLIEPYHLDCGDVFHIDLYRVVEEEELYFLGFSELDAGVRLVEWPERAPDLAKSADLQIRLDYEGDGRRLTMHSIESRADDLVADLSSRPNT